MDNIQEIKTDIVSEFKTSFLDYAISVIAGRALPSSKDGLKPVQRKVLYTLYILKVYHNSAYKKSARIVGEVMGKYHPHGDSSIYMAMVRMAQDFSLRYPLVDGHGNFGSIDGDPPAAMRYTEVRMAKIATEFMNDLGKEVVRFVNNYDNSEQEPIFLPTSIPNLLLNGASGIAVGMATNIPPHNLTEVLTAAKMMIKNPELSVEDLTKYIPAPDFPTGGIVYQGEGLRKAYETGRGSIVLQAKYHFESNKNKNSIVITEIPYQVNKASLLIKIAQLAKDKIIQGIRDLRDESNRSGIRIVVELGRNSLKDVVINQLFKHSQLQIKFAFNNVCLVDGTPQLLNLRKILQLFISYRLDIIQKRTEYEIKIKLKKINILKGLQIALANIDQTIKVIRNSQNNQEALMNLQTTFKLNKIQAHSILDMRLARLTSLETLQIANDLSDNEAELSRLQSLSESDQLKKDLLSDSLTTLIKMHGDKRRTEVSDKYEDLNELDFIHETDDFLILTSENYIKRIPKTNFRLQKRGGKGVSGLNKKQEILKFIVDIKSRDQILFFANNGKVYRLLAYKIPLTNKHAKGIPLNNLIDINLEQKVSSIIVVKEDDYNKNLCFVFATKKGLIKKTYLSEYKNINRNGKIALKLRKGDALVGVKLASDNHKVLMAASNGKIALFNNELFHQTSRATYGVHGMKLKHPSYVIGVEIITDDNNCLLLATTNGYGKKITVDNFCSKNRNLIGIIGIKITEKTGALVQTALFHNDTEVVLSTRSGNIIRLDIKNIPSYSGRATQGVKLIKMENDTIKTLITLKPSANA